MSADMKASLEELAALAGPPPPGSTLENVWKEYLGGLMQSLKQTDYIEHLEETIAVLKSKNAEFHNLVKDKKVAVTFLRYTDESQAYEVLGLKDSITDKELTDNLESKFKFSRGMLDPVSIAFNQIGAICCIAKARSQVIYLQSLLASFIRRELEAYIRDLGFPGVIQFTSPEFDLPVVKPVTFNTVALKDAYKILKITEKSTDREIAKIVSPLSPLHSFSPEQQGAILAVWAKLPQPNCLEYLRNSITTAEAQAHLKIVIPQSSAPMKKVINISVDPTPLTIQEVKSLDEVYRILGIRRKATFKEFDEAYDGDFAQQKLPRGAILFLGEHPPSHWTPKEVETLRLYALSAILQELSSYLMNLEGIPRSCVEFYQKETRLIESLGLPLEEYIRQHVAMFRDIKLYKTKLEELSLRDILTQAALNTSRGNLEKSKQELRTSEKALKVKEGGLLASRTSVKDLEKRLAKWVKNGEISSQRIEELELDLEGKKLEIEKLQVAADVSSTESKSRIVELEAEVHRLKIELSSERAQSKKRIDFLNSSLEKEKEKVKIVEDELRSARIEVKKLELSLTEIKTQSENASVSGINDDTRGTRNDRSDFLFQTLASQLKTANDQVAIKTAENLELLMRLSGIED